MIAEKLFNELPAKFRRLMQNVVIVTEDFASAEVLASMQIESAYDLLGLYEGVPLTERQIAESGSVPDLIHLYREPILAMQAESGESISACIRNVMVHEIGHHFGFSDAQMHAIEQESKP
ncbi:possibl zinc metallo-peptidase [Mariprofundus micogutta]|uniref:Possibl zinc metallo-peptidase n=2 Tax=Mariprofundus micogutta TaxID=1921010 RepID=A0A1L8CPN6_9PROT|nr:possibl zinc metallo-peptidase [Mariprofundus micogutta]